MGILIKSEIPTDSLRFLVRYEGKARNYAYESFDTIKAANRFRRMLNKQDIDNDVWDLRLYNASIDERNN